MNTKKTTLSKFEKDLLVSSNIEVKANTSLAELISLNVSWLRNNAFYEDYLNDMDIDTCNFSVQDSDIDVEIGFDGTMVSVSGDYVKITSCGDSGQISMSGDNGHIGVTNSNNRISTSGKNTFIFSDGDHTCIGTSGVNSVIGVSGNHSQVSASGEKTIIAISGDSVHVSASGDYSKIKSTGKNAIITATGYHSSVAANVGSYITLAEKIKNKISVKTEYVDGKRIKADTFYKLVNGNFEKA